MERGSALDSSGLPSALLAPTPRRVGVSVAGGAMLAAAMALVAAGIWGNIVFGRRADTAERHLRLFESERVVTAGEIIRLQKRGGDDDYRTTAHYRYVARGRELTGSTRLRRSERDRYDAGSQIAVWYLASEPDTSWLDGYAPSPQPGWPATVIPLVCGVAAVALIQLVRRQSHLLTYGRPVMGTVTKVEKKRSDEGTFWLVHYEWTTLSGATRKGKYRQGKKNPPGPGTFVPVVYDRDNNFRHSKYPMLFVSISDVVTSGPPPPSLPRHARRARPRSLAGSRVERS